MKHKLVICILISYCLMACKEQATIQETKVRLSEPAFFHDALDDLTDVIVHDIFSPPVASRVYAYPCIAAYQCMNAGTALSLDERLTDLNNSPVPSDENAVRELAAMEAFFLVAQKLIFSEQKITASKEAYYTTLDSLEISKDVIQSSKAYANQVAAHIIEWGKIDNYDRSRSFSKFSISDEPAEWKPTPPAYMEGIEPHWRSIRTLVLDSAQQFKPLAPPKYDLSKGSEFHKITMEVYETVKNVTEDQRAIASFWDCNPYVMNQTGHLMFATKKITPGGHWMGISNIASRTSAQSLKESIQTSTYVAIALFDAFISCWDEKYRSNLVRPETVINNHFDESWKPVLQTPPFPEHTSGHSVISTAAAVTLTSIFGEAFSYTDDVEVKYGLPKRKFNSFMEAAEEAAISRLYGGIHYMPAISDGVKQGKEIGEKIVERLNIKSD